MGTPMGFQNRPDAQQQYFNPQQLLNDPMASMAMQYGQNLAGQGREIVHEKIEKYVSISKLKYVKYIIILIADSIENKFSIIFSMQSPIVFQVLFCCRHIVCFSEIIPTSFPIRSQELGVEL